MTYTLPNPPIAIDAGQDSAPEYPAAAFRSALGALLHRTPGDQAVARTGALDMRSLEITLSGQTIRAAAGGYTIGTRTGPYLCGLDEQVDVDQLAPADPTNPRVDLAILRVDDPDNGGTDAASASIEVVTGTPSPNPSLPQVEGTDVFASLSRIDVPRQGQGQPALTDLRKFTVAQGGVLVVSTETELEAEDAGLGTLAYVVGTGAMHVRTGGAFGATRQWKRMEMVDETEWVRLTPRSPFRNYSSASPAYVKRAGRVVTITGTYGTDGDPGQSVMTSLPPQFRPQHSMFAIMQGTGLNRWQMRVNADGTVQFDRYGPGSAGNNIWLPFSMTWVI